MEIGKENLKRFPRPAAAIDAPGEIGAEVGGGLLGKLMDTGVDGTVSVIANGPGPASCRAEVRARWRS